MCVRLLNVYYRFSMLRVESSDFLSYTEFEEEILFDEDDPDFAKQDVMPTISLPLVLRGKFNIIVNDPIINPPTSRNWIQNVSSRIDRYQIVIKYGNFH